MVYLLWYCQMVFHTLLIKISIFVFPTPYVVQTKKYFLGFSSWIPTNYKKFSIVHLISLREWTKQRRIREWEIKGGNQILVHIITELCLNEHVSRQNSVSFSPASFCTTRPILSVTSGIAWLPTFLYSSPYDEKDIFMGC